MMDEEDDMQHQQMVDMNGNMVDMNGNIVDMNG